jgi:hypothetical protein
LKNPLNPLSNEKKWGGVDFFFEDFLACPLTQILKKLSHISSLSFILIFVPTFPEVKTDFK